ncbi:MAG: murein biosynthesis integral membrane protein MurJ [Jiangellales bacterium]
MSDRIGRATAIMAVGTTLSRATGFIRAAMIAATLGLGLTGDMFAVADALPAAMYTIVAGGVLNAVLVPQLVRSMQRDADGGEAYAQRLASAVLLLLAVTTVLLVVAAPLVTGLYTSAEFDSPALAAQRDTIITLARFTLVQVFFYGLYTLLGQMLNARGRFGPMMFAPILNNLIAIAVFGSFWALMGPLDPRAGEFTPAQAAWFGLGSTVGIAAQALVLLPVLRRSGLRLRLRTDLRGVGLGKAFRLGAWTVALITIMQATQIVVIRLATSATAVAAATDIERGAGIAVYNNAFLIIMVPHSIITVSLATALLPDLSRTAAAAQTEQLRTRVMDALRVALAVIIPFAGLIAATAGPISLLLFGYGAASTDVDLVAVTLALFVPGLVGFTTTFLVQRAFYAQEDTRTPVFVQLVVSAVQIGLAVALVPRIDPVLVSATLAGCWSVATLVGALASLWLLHRRLGRLGGLRFTGFVLAVGIAALPGTILALALTLRYPQIAVGSPLGALATLAAGTAIAASVYVLVAWLVRIRPVRDGVAAVMNIVRTRIGARR